MNAEMLLHAIGTIDDKFIEEAAPREKIKVFSKPKAKSSHIWRIATFAASFAVLLVVFAVVRNIWNNNLLPQPPISPAPDHSQTTIPTVSPTQNPEVSPSHDLQQRILTALIAGQHEPRVMLADGDLNFLAIDTNVGNPAPPPIDPEMTYKEQWNLGTVIDYLGMDFRPSYVPDDLHEREEEPYWTVIFNNDGTKVPYSFTFGLMYSEHFEDVYDPLGRTLIIKAAKDEFPFSCSFYATEADVSSNINETLITVGYCNTPYGGNHNTPEGYYDVYVAEFMYDGIGYAITSANLTQEEFINVLLSIVKE